MVLNGPRREVHELDRRFAASRIGGELRQANLNQPQLSYQQYALRDTTTIIKWPAEPQNDGSRHEIRSTTPLT